MKSPWNYPKEDNRDTDNPPQEVGITPTVKMIKDRYERGRDALAKETQQYWINRAFTAGDQWVDWDYDRRIVTVRRMDRSRVRIKFNRIWPASRTIHGKWHSRNLEFEVPPNGSDDATVNGANIAQAVCRDLHKRHRWEDVRANTDWATWLGGTGFIAIDWDPSAGDTLAQDPATGRNIGKGDTRESALSIVEVAFEPGVRDFETGQWWIRSQALPPSVVKETYDLDELPKADTQTMLSPSQRSIVQGEGIDVSKLTLVLTYYERPSKANPKGCVATVVEDKFVEEPKEWPFPFKDRLNIVAFRETLVPGKAAGDTVVSAAIEVQTAYNAAWSSMLENMKLVGNPRLLMPDAVLDGVGTLTDLPGQVIPYTTQPGGDKPSWMSPAPMPVLAMDLEMRISQQIDDILGIHAVSRGQAPTNIESGVGLSVLVEQDSTPIGHLIKETAHGWGRVASLVLAIYADKVETSRSAVVDDAMISKTVRWTGKSLSGQTTAIVPEEAIQPRSKAAMFAQAKDLLDRKVITPNQFVQMAEIQGPEDIMVGLNADAARAKDENADMAAGVVRLPDDFDSHGDHIFIHNTFRKSRRYMALSEEDRKIFNDHVQAHETMAAEEAGKLAAQQNVHPALAAAPTAQEIPAIPGMIPEGPGSTSPVIPTPNVPGVPTSAPAAPPGGQGGPPPQL